MFRNKEALTVWRNKAKQLQFLENSHKLNKCKNFNKILFSLKQFYHS